ncbi:hypothetical protein HanRHA438_Chr05g0238121 [Helianthus annuus]|uniref:Uncharacterized protein n=1 Tax=Helianthus annuus TaxID=4232 RepID=A0A9K3NPU8_HELAN|nr:hypothetical protein HanXRQr2_Chr05g0229041 [Helianthus annuus]KAF5807039.1 hypothetical protein HanXRQr2_Chr05g0229051 [Helianthus annuus]KAJ0585570.1 hypothetical protein HanHA89_Chr05g0202251 [Helianthus annuus]KAJ0920147.1 hypothetical protein HanRHA438_Chr05g0238121 [Helianthus annuus]
MQSIVSLGMCSIIIHDTPVKHVETTVRTTYTNSGSDSEENVDDDPRERQSTGDGIGDDSAMR